MRRRQRLARAFMCAGLVWAAIHESRSQHWTFVAACIVLMLYFTFIYDERSQ